MQQFENEPRTSSLSRSLSGIDFVAREINKLRTEVSLQVIDSSSKICSLRHPPREDWTSDVSARRCSMEIRQHLRFAARQLRRNPGFTATVIITLALSIGANTAIFSLLNALMLKSLPYSHAERMGTIYTRATGFQPSDERHGPNG